MKQKELQKLLLMYKKIPKCFGKYNKTKNCEAVGCTDEEQQLCRLAKLRL